MECLDANNGEVVEGGAEDDVSTESGGQLEEWADSDREGTLGRNTFRPVSNLMFA